MLRFCLDTSALLSLRDNEPGAVRVAQPLEAPVRCVACFFTRMEVLDRVWNNEGERAGRLAGGSSVRNGWVKARKACRGLERLKITLETHPPPVIGDRKSRQRASAGAGQSFRAAQRPRPQSSRP